MRFGLERCLMRIDEFLWHDNLEDVAYLDQALRARRKPRSVNFKSKEAKDLK